MRKRRSLFEVAALIAATSVLGLGALAAGGTATAAPSGGATAPTSGPGYIDLVRQLTQTAGVTAVGVGADDTIVVRTTPSENAPVAGPSVRDVVGGYDNVVVQDGGQLEAQSVDDLVGGAGYAAFETPTSTEGGLCSVGFDGWDGSGNPVVISAGHCVGQDGALVLASTTVPENDTAYGGAPPKIQAPLGTVGFFRYGGPDGSVGSAADLSSTDISIIENLNPGLDLSPRVTTWSAPPTNDLAASTLTVTGLAQPVIGREACRSGRTTGFVCGELTVDNGWAKVSGRWVYGFGGMLGSAHGDSGGPVIQNGKAIGLVSGGDDKGFTWSTNLVNALSVAVDFTIMQAVDAPVVTSIPNGGQIAEGDPIEGSAPVGSLVTVAFEDAPATDVPTDAVGNWSIVPPAVLGATSFTIRAAIGFNRSDAVPFDVTLVPAAAAATPGGGEDRLALANTGSGAVPFAGAGVLLLLGGAVLLIRRRAQSLR